MKPRIPRQQLRAFARECLKLEQLLSEPDDLAELGKFLHLIRSMEKSGGLSALEALLRPEHTDAANVSAVTSPLKDALRPFPTTPTKPQAKNEMP
jgi:hypothetical protein